MSAYFDFQRQAYNPGNSQTGISVTDIDGDGNADILIGNYGARSVTIWKFDPMLDALASDVTITGFGYNIHDVEEADIDNDGDLDMLVGTRGLGAYSVENLGDGTFAAPVRLGTPYSWQVLPADFDGDGNMDFFHGTISFANMYYGRGDGTFYSGPRPTPPVYNAPGRGMTAIDINDDGKLDLVGVQGGPSSSRLLVYLNNSTPGSPAWSSNLAASVPALGYTGTGAAPAAGDTNADGFVDIATVEGIGSANVIVFEGGPGYTWAARTIDTISEAAYYTIMGDVNGDGRDDVIVAGGPSGMAGLALYYSEEDGSFTKELIATDARYGGLNGLSIADVNDDGFNDIVAVRHTLTGSNDGFEVFYGSPRPVVCDLFHGKKAPVDVGDVTFNNVSGTLSVTIAGEDNWTLEEVKLHVGDVDLVSGDLIGFPINRGGNAKLGHFDYKLDATDGEILQTFDLETLMAADQNGDGIVAIAIHAEFSVEDLVQDGSTRTVEENAWAGCDEFDIDFGGASGAQALMIDLADLALYIA